MENLKMLKNKHDTELCFYENELQKAKDYFMPTNEMYFSEDFIGTIEEYKAYKKELKQYEQELLNVESLEELCAVLNRYTNKFNDGTEYYIKEL